MTNTDIQDSTLSLISKNWLWAIVGVLVGWLGNKINTYLDKTLPVTYLGLVLQLLVLSTLLGILHKAVLAFGWSWQNTTPGLFFVSVFFGVQFTTFEAVKSIWNSEDGPSRI